MCATLPPILTRQAVADLLGISPETLKRWEAEGRVPRCKLSQKVVVYVTEQLVAWVAAHAQPVTGAETARPRGQGERGGARLQRPNPRRKI